MNPPRQTPDRMLRDSLRTKENLRDFLEAALPQEVANMDFNKVEEWPPEFFSGDWHEREADLIFTIGYNLTGRTVPAVVGILIEHYSDTETPAPLRALCNVTGFWERHWRQWEQSPSPRGRFVLPPAFSVVLYTGGNVWGGKKNVRELLDEPASFHPFAPDWGPIFWNLAERTPDALLAGGAWMQLLAIMRVWEDEQAEYERVLTHALRQVAALDVSQHVRWSYLTRCLWMFSRFRRPPEEHAQLAEIVQRENPEKSEEVKAMVKSIQEADEERGEQRGSLQTARTLLLCMIEDRFKTVPDNVRQRIEQVTDVVQLSTAARQVYLVKSLDEIQL